MLYLLFSTLFLSSHLLPSPPISSSFLLAGVRRLSFILIALIAMLARFFPKRKSVLFTNSLQSLMCIPWWWSSSSSSSSSSFFMIFMISARHLFASSVMINGQSPEMRIGHCQRFNCYWINEETFSFLIVFVCLKYLDKSLQNNVFISIIHTQFIIRFSASKWLMLLIKSPQIISNLWQLLKTYTIYNITKTTTKRIGMRTMYKY